MGEITDRFDAMTVRAYSPDGQIFGVVRGGQIEDCEFVEGAYEQYEKDELEHQVSRLATRLYTGHERGRRDILSEAGFAHRRDIANARSKSEREYLERVYTIAVEGAGPRDDVWLVTSGMLEWGCEIKEGALNELTENEFLEEVMAAGREVLRNTAYEVWLLKDEFFGTGIPQLRAERERRRARGIQRKLHRARFEVAVWSSA